MHDLSLMAATEWARTNTNCEVDPVEFGHKVALAYCACERTQYHSGNEKATAAALASLSIPPEMLQALALLSALSNRPTAAAGLSQTDLAGAKS